MRIAFVGKGGSGKTTLSALFSQYMASTVSAPVLVIDADLNIHLPELLGFGSIKEQQYLSHPEASKDIKMFLKGDNSRVRELVHFRKTTPPTRESNFIVPQHSENYIVNKYTARRGNLFLGVVGTYQEEQVGVSCYHNNLAILENLLTHMLDNNSTVVVDMVAGIDAFANTLHAQFDMLVLVVEPTRKGIEVFNQYRTLAEAAGMADLLFVIGNKVRNSTDEAFIKQFIPETQLLGYFGESSYLRAQEQDGGALDLAKLEPQNVTLLDTIQKKLLSTQIDAQARIHHLYELHKKYVAQDFITERFGDLSNQIDASFNIAEVFARYE